nr:tyrosine-type recombinase/integrase [Chloroflexia bacterium]
MPESEPARSRSALPTSARRTRRAPVDGLTAVERERPYTDDPALLTQEEHFAAEAPDQLPLFVPGPAGAFAPSLGGLPPLSAGSSLDLARAWYRRELEQAGRPLNTIESYCYDLVVLEKLIGPKPIAAIGQSDIARLLGDANGRATRKRRLTSARRFFRFLIDDARVLRADPTEGHYPHTIPLRSPVPLFPAEQDAMLEAAAADEAWALPAIWLMLRLGLTRAELLALRREHIDLADSSEPIVYIFYDDVTKRGKERKLAGGEAFRQIYEQFLDTRSPVDLLFPVGPQAVNGMVERVRAAAGIQKDVTPQTLRHTFAVDRATAGATEE